jgi:hypothetical protein
MATLAVVTALVVSAVATAPALAGERTFDGVTVKCANTAAGAVFTVEFKGQTFTSPAIPHLTCPF